jgi:hypothetical protein
MRDASVDRIAPVSRGLIPVLCLLACFFASCWSTQPEPTWVQGKVGAASDRVLREVTALALLKSGFPGGSGIEPGKLTAVSGWHISLAPFRGKGYREQCEVKYTPVGTMEYQVDVRVRREKNDDIVKPLDITYADWTVEPDNPEHAQIVLQYIKSMLGSPFELSGKKKPQPAAEPKKQPTPE